MTSPSVANPIIAFTRAPIASSARLEYNKKVLTYLGIVEFVIGSVSIVFSGVTVGYMSGWLNNEFSKKSPFADCNGHCYPFTMGEGIWCGVWVLIGGALGIASGRKRSTLCLIYCHMGFSIVGATSSGVLLSIGIVIASVNGTPLLICFESLLVFGGFVTFILCILSAAFCCKTASSTGLNTCCGTCCVGEQLNQVGVGQAMFLANPNQQAQQTIVQTYSSNRTGQQEHYPGNIVTVMQHGIVAGQQPGFVAQQQPAAAVQQSGFVAMQPAVVTQQYPSSSSESSQRFQAERKQKEACRFSRDATSSAEYRDTPPSYSQDV